MDDLFEAAGELTAGYRRVDWASTSLGPVSSWSTTLRTVLGMAFRTRFPMTLFWGPEYVMLYNEAYVEMIGDKHPASLGSRSADVFPEIWDTIGPMMTMVATTRQASWSQDLRLLMDRHGFLEECFFTFSYSAVAGDDGRIEGVVDIAAETTSQILSQRRLALLATLTDRLAAPASSPELADRALAVLRTEPSDLVEVAVGPGSVPDDLAVTTVDGAPLARIGIGPGRVLTARLSPHLVVDDAVRRFLKLIGVALTQAFDRAQARQAERRVIALERNLSEALQRSLLTEPARPDGLEVAVRYHPAAEQAHVGGDWYDAFRLPDGQLAIAVGDVTGHDHRAAAAMAQVRNLLRGVAYTGGASPAPVLQALDGAMRGLAVDALATAVLARVEPGGPGGRILRWSNAGHPHPYLLGPDGAVTALDAPPEILLGAGAAARRTDHTVRLAAGASVVFYTDGLVDRRDSTIDDGFAALRQTLAGRQELTAEQLCDHVLDRFAAAGEDDMVIVVLRVRPPARPVSAVDDHLVI